MGGLRPEGLHPEAGQGRLPGRLHVARPLGQRPDGRFAAAARLRGAAHPGRHGAGVPLGCRSPRRRRHSRHARHLLYARHEGALRRRRRPLSLARPDRPGHDAGRLGHPPHVGARVEPPRALEPLLLRSPRAGRPDDAFGTALAPELRRHALRQRPALQVPRQPCRLQGHPALPRVAVRRALRRAAAAGRGHGDGVRRRQPRLRVVDTRCGLARGDGRTRRIHRLHTHRRRRLRPRHLYRKALPHRRAGAAVVSTPTV